MNRIPKAKLKFLVSLTVKHSKHGNRSISHKVAMANLDRLTLDVDDTVLDVGCGTGDETVVIATMVKKVTAIDVSQDILEIARRDFPADNVEYLLDDLGDASPNAAGWRESTPFSKVVSIDRVMFYPDVAGVLRTMVACLKPGGELLCAIPNNAFNFFGGPAKIIEEHPEWGQELKAKKINLFLWKRTEEEAEAFFKDMCEWSSISCQAQRFITEMTDTVAKAIWFDNLEQLDMINASGQSDCLRALWQWAQSEYEFTEDGRIKKPSEFIVVHGVKKA